MKQNKNNNEKHEMKFKLLNLRLKVISKLISLIIQILPICIYVHNYVHL